MHGRVDGCCLDTLSEELSDRCMGELMGVV